METRLCEREIYSWAKELGIDLKSQSQGYKKIYNELTNTGHPDIVGIIYQSLLQEGSKSSQGSYYTPIDIVDSIFSKFCGPRAKFLDPCCGTGQFLLGAVRAGFANPECIYGYDIDDLAVHIARINLLLAFPDREFIPQLHHANFLTDIANGQMFCETNHLENAFFFIATNPPWGSVVFEEDGMSIKSMYPHITSGESFSLFLSKCIDLSKTNGCISFLLPESILNIKVHSDIRQQILKNTSINAIHLLGRKFKGVFTPIVRIDLTKTIASDEWAVDIIKKNGEAFKTPQSRFKSNQNKVFDVAISNDDSTILSSLYNMQHVTLKNNAEWALGIVTGDNKKYVTSKKSKGMEPIYRGRDIDKFCLKVPGSYIEFKPEEFQQVAPERKYRAAEKLVYKFISKKLVFAYDTKGSLTLNSANILLPKIEKYPTKVLLALLNSTLYQYLFSKKFNTHKVLRGDLENLPFPILTDKENFKIISLVDQALEGADVHVQLDREINRIIGLSSQQISTITNFVKGS